MFLRIFLSTIGSVLTACLFISTHLILFLDIGPFVFFSCLLGVYVGVMWGLYHKGVFDKK